MGSNLSAATAAVIASLLTAPLATTAHAQAPPFTIQVGSAPGSGYDLPARVVARHFGRSLAGGPTVIVRNMPGANGITLANYMAARAPRDGSEIGLVQNTIVIDAVLGNAAVRYKADEFAWIGSTSPLTNACIVRAKAPAVSLADATRQELRVGATGVTDATAIVPQFLNSFIGTKFKVIRGYQSTSNIYIAVESGELDGVCAAWDSILKWRPQGVTAADIKALVQVGAAPDPLLPGVPFVMDLVKDQADKAALKFLVGRQAFARPFVAPPGVSPDKTDELRRAFMRTMQDPQMIEDAQRAGLPLDPVDGATVQRMVQELLQTPADVVKRASAAIE
jgi:tripartite-type tricarboxylate transporter receptor subunit TctC